MTVVEKQSISSEPKMSYEEYKVLVNKDDIKNFTQNLKPYWWENLPVLGSMIYAIRISIKVSGIDRGLLRKEITKSNLIFLFIFLIYIYALLVMLTPWFGYWIYITAVKRAEKKIENNEQN